MKKLISTSLAALLWTASAWAHEGHDKTPGATAAPHGGLIQGTSQVYAELLMDQKDVKLYVLDHESKPIPTAEVKLKATATLPKKSKADPVVFNPQGDHWAATYDAKGAHRYELNIEVDYKGKKEKVKFNVEPQ